jgi:L-fuconolactonase
MLISDSQVHIWAANTPERPWAPGTRPHRAEPLGHEELLREMNAAGVDRVVIVPPSLDGLRNDLALAAAHAHPDRFAVMGNIDVKDPQARARLACWRAPPGNAGPALQLQALAQDARKRRCRTYTSTWRS